MKVLLSQQPPALHELPIQQGWVLAPQAVQTLLMQMSVALAHSVGSGQQRPPEAPHAAQVPAWQTKPVPQTAPVQQVCPDIVPHPV